MKSLLAIPLFAASLCAQMYPATWKLAHPDAKALIGIDVRTIRESAAMEQYSTELEKSGAAMFIKPAMAFLKNVDEVFISSPGARPGSKAKNPPFLVVVTGHFSRDEVQGMLGRPTGLHGTFDLYGSSPDMRIAMIDEHTLVAGDEKSLHAGIDRMGQHPDTSNALMARAAALAADHEFWMIATVPPSAFQPQGVNLSPMAAEIQGMDAGLSVKDGMRFELSLSTKTVDGAKMMAGMLATQLKLVPQADEIVKKLEISQEGARMGVKLALNREEVDRLVKTMRPAGSPAFGGSTSTVAAAPPKRQTIRIEGLDDGPREIPLEQK